MLGGTALLAAPSLSSIAQPRAANAQADGPQERLARDLLPLLSARECGPAEDQIARVTPACRTPRVMLNMPTYLTYL